jgi:CRP-like cAMP-binding protein
MSDHGGSFDCSSCPLGRSARGLNQVCPFVPRQRGPRELIYIEGEAASCAWFIKRGRVALTRELDDGHGEGRVRTVRFAGNMIGLEALAGDRYRDTARAIAPTVLCGAPRVTLDAWLGPPGAPARTVLALALRGENDELMRRAGPDGNAEKRVAGWLRKEAADRTTLLLPRRIAADLLGMRPETLSRALRALARRELIRTTRREVEILDPIGLAEVAGQVTW